MSIARSGVVTCTVPSASSQRRVTAPRTASRSAARYFFSSDCASAHRRRFAEQENDLGRAVRLKLHPGLQGAAGIEAGADAIGQRRGAGQSSRLIERAVAAEELRSVAGPRLLPAGEIGERHAVPELGTPGIPREHRPGRGIDLGDDERRAWRRGPRRAPTRHRR